MAPVLALFLMIILNEQRSAAVASVFEERPVTAPIGVKVMRQGNVIKWLPGRGQAPPLRETPFLHRRGGACPRPGSG